MKNIIITIQSIIIAGMLFGIGFYKHQSKTVTPVKTVDTSLSVSNKLTQRILYQSEVINKLTAAVYSLEVKNNNLTKQLNTPKVETERVVVEVDEPIRRPRTGRLGRMGF